jgi:hypothetical protein
MKNSHLFDRIRFRGRPQAHPDSVWLNHLHFNDIRRQGKRPMLYSRWGGLGNHRCYVGFSGDAYAYVSHLNLTSAPPVAPSR